MSSTVQILHTSEPEFTLWKHYFHRLEQKGIYHSPEYIKILEKYFQDEAELFIFEDERSFVYYPYLRRRLDKLPFAERFDLDLTQYLDIVSSWYYGGPIISTNRREKDSDKFLIKCYLDCFRDYCQSSHIISEFIRFDPNIRNYEYFYNHLPVKFNRETVYIDLNQSETEIWAQYKGRCRTAIRKGEKYPIHIQVVKSDDFLDNFAEIYHNEMIKKNAPSHYLFPKKFFQDLFSTLQERAILFIVMHDQKPVGGSICLIEPAGVAYDYLTATLPDYWKFQINNLLMHEVILWCKNAGAKIYDFHGGRDGVTFFKASFSRLRRSFAVSKIIHNQQIYNLLVSAKQRFCPGDSVDFFPSYRSKDTN